MSVSKENKYGFVDYYVDSELAVLTMTDSAGGNVSIATLSRLSDAFNAAIWTTAFAYTSPFQRRNFSSDGSGIPPSVDRIATSAKLPSRCTRPAA
jgi:hypothetical protein